MKEDIFKIGLKILAKNLGLLSELGDMPNINFPTMGGEIWWNDLANYNGWRIQQNTIFKNCRILDLNNVRRAWGGIDVMERIFEKLAKSNL